MQRVAGLNVKALREKRGLSQDSFARLLGVHRTYLEGVELGQHPLNLNKLERIARLIDADPIALLMQAVSSRHHAELRGR